MKLGIFSKNARKEFVKVIREADGNEVFFVGSFGDGDVIENVRVIARGNDYSVPAVVDSAKSGEVVIHNHPSGNLTPSDQDIQMASVFGNHGVGFYIANNDASQVYVVVERFKEVKIKELETEDIKQLLMPNGKVAGSLGSNYEMREEQIRMLDAVSSAFNEDLISIIEAGTGTGKTLSYLIPSVYWSLQNGERVIISTNTINLQEQLSQKDIPLVHSSLNERFKHSLVKGMGNYLCLLRADTVADGILEFAEDEEIKILSDILDWSKVTEDGSLSDLNFTPPEGIWDKVSAESDSCLRVRCPHYSNCFYYKARRDVASSQLIVANHHIVFSDLAIKGASEENDSGILPPYKRIIFDEAHHIVDAATSHFGMRATKFGIIRALRRLKRKGNSGEIKGLIFYTANLTTKLRKYFKKGVLNKVLRRIEEKLSPQVDAAEERVLNTFDELYYFSLPIVEAKEGQKKEIKLRITEDIFETAGWEEIEKKFSILSIKLNELFDEIKNFIDVLMEYEVETDVAKILVEFKGVGNKVNYFSQVIDSFLDREDDGYIRWIEGREGKGGILSGIGLSPLDISPHLRERLYSSCNTIVMTSATMAVGDNFNFVRSGLGLNDNNRIEEHILPSSFDYEQQTLLAIPNNIPEPTEIEYSTTVSPVIFDAVKASGGDALILFTSYSLLELVYKEISEGLDNLGLIPLKQGSLPRARLLDKFRKEVKSVLFATDSFWEGVDVPGDALRLVIITRLPFRVPTDPIIEARVEYMERQGLDPFLEYTVPVAVLKFKQGFGRLIRSHTDKGAVLVLDKRIISKFYGKYFLESLPRCKKVIGKTDHVLEKLDRFFDVGSLGI
ncbi:MAG: DEAD/DEAH box helicase family protein [Deltaproteobacteria bacterium]|nr:DEAD/DEAH box helicase family protein [Deltaproteobacteria bacterium]